MSLEDQLRVARQALWDCLVASGADVSDYDGPENWPGGTSLEELAVREVRQLRVDLDVEASGFWGEW